MPAWIPAAIAAGATIFDGMQNRKQQNRNFDAQIQNAREDRVWNAEQAEIARSESDRYQRALLADQFSIMAKGAREAGYHPLAALGAPSQPSQGVVIPGQSNLGSVRKDVQGTNIGAGANAGYQAYQNQQYNQAVIDNMNADTQLKLSEISRNTQPGKANPHGDWPAMDFGGRPVVSRVKFEKLDQGTEMVEVKPAPNVTTQAADSSTSAGKNPAFSEYDLGLGVSLYGLYSEEGAADSFPVSAIPVLALKNASAFGKWLDKALGIDHINVHPAQLKKLLSQIRSGKVKSIAATRKTRRQTKSFDTFVPYSRGPNR